MLKHFKLLLLISAVSVGLLLSKASSSADEGNQSTGPTYGGGYTILVGTPVFPGVPIWHQIPVAKGAPLDADEQAYVEAAITAGEALEAMCPSLPTLPGGQKGSEGVRDADVGRETAKPRANKEPGDASTIPAMGAGTHTLASGDTWSVSGNPDGVNIRGAVLDAGVSGESGYAGKVKLFSKLVHEAYHLKDPNGVDSPDAAREQGAYHHEIDWWCALANCANDTAVTAFARATIDVINAWLIAHDATPKLCQLPGETAPSLPSSPSFGPFRTLAHEAYLPVGTNNYGVGFVTVDPGMNVLNLFSWTGPSTFDIDLDMGVEIPGFQITCVDLPTPYKSNVIAVGGYDTATGEGMLIRGVVDLSQQPVISFSTEYKGQEFSGVLDIYSHQDSPNQVLVLDELGYVLACNLVSDTCTILATPAQEPELLSARELTVLQSASPGQPVQHRTYVATSGSAEDVFKIGSEASNTEVHLLDVGGDLTIESITVK